MEPQWNPAAEAQAIDRIHRLGQKKPVICVRYIMANSFEEKILKIQEKKNNLANMTMEQGKSSKAALAKQRLDVCFPPFYSGRRCGADFLAAFEGSFQQELGFRLNSFAEFLTTGFRLAFASGHNGPFLSFVTNVFFPFFSGVTASFARVSIIKYGELYGALGRQSGVGSCVICSFLLLVAAGNRRCGEL